MGLLSKLSLKYKLLFGILPAVLFATGFVVYVGSISSNIESSFGQIDETFLELRTISRLDVLNTRLAEVTKAFVLTDDIKWQTTYDDTTVEFDKLYNDALKSATPTDKQELQNFELLANRIKGTELLILYKTRNGQREEAIKLFDTIYSGEQQSASKVLTDYVENKSQSVSDDIKAVLQRLDVTENIVIFASIVFIAIIILLFLFILSIYILRPLQNLVETTKAIKAGNLSAKSKVYSDDEIGNLAQSFNSMTENLSDQIKKFDTLFKEQEKSRVLLMKREQELTSANEMLLDLDKRKAEFISIAAHQLRTPLSGIKWTLASILAGEMGKLSAEQNVYLKKTYASNERIIALVGDMLYADRVEAGKNQLVLEEADITLLIDSVLQDLNQKIHAKNLKIIYSKKDSVPKTKFDSEKMRAVVQNILENSVKYTEPGGVISIEVIRKATEIEVWIKDSGIGIPKSQLPYLFTKFFRAKNAIRAVTDGTGLGLFIAKNIIDQHGGKIRCETEEGKGSAFIFTLKI